MSHGIRDFDPIMLSIDSRIINTPESTPLYVAGARGRHRLAPDLVGEPRLDDTERQRYRVGCYCLNNRCSCFGLYGYMLRSCKNEDFFAIQVISRGSDRVRVTREIWQPPDPARPAS